MYSLNLYQPGEEIGGSTRRGRPGGTKLVGLGVQPVLSVPEYGKEHAGWQALGACLGVSTVGHPDRP